MKTTSCLLLFLASVALAAEPPAKFTVTKENAFTVSRDMKRMTKEAYTVSAQFLGACAGFSSSPMDSPPPEAPSNKPYPHATLGMYVYLNTLAEAALLKKANAYPVGAMIVKEKLDNAGAVTGVGGMIKRAKGYDADNGDWEYFYADKRGRFTHGRTSNCVNCHSGARKTDFVFANWLEKK